MGKGYRVKNFELSLCPMRSDLAQRDRCQAEEATVFPSSLHLADILALLLWFPPMRVFLSCGW